MLILSWISTVHHHGHNRLRGLVIVSLLLPILAGIIYALEQYLAGSLDADSLYWHNIIGDCRLYSESLFDIWQLWTYVFFHDNIFQLLLNVFFLLPIAFYWERHFGLWFILTIILLLPVCVVFFVLSNTIVPDVGTSPLVVAMYAAVLLHDRGMLAELGVFTWWGTQIRLRRVSLALSWILVAFILLDLSQWFWRSFDMWQFSIYVMNIIVAACAGSSVYAVMDHLRQRLLLEAEETQSAT